MRISISIIVFISILLSGVYAEEINIVEEYIEIIESRELTQDDVDDFYKRDLDYDALGLFLEARILLYNYEYEEAYNKLESALEISKDDRLRLEINYYLAELDRAFYKVSSLLNRANESKTLAESLDEMERLADIYILIAYAYFDTFDDDEAINLAEKSIRLSESIGYDYGASKAFFFLSDINYYYNEYDLMIENVDKATKAVGNKYVNSVVGEYLIDVDFYAIDSEYLSGESKNLEVPILSLIKKVDGKDSFSVSYLYQYLGRHFKDKDLNKSVDYYNKSLEFYNMTSLVPGSYNFGTEIILELGFLYYELGDYEKASRYMYDSLMTYNDSSDDEYIKLLETLDEYKLESINERMNLLEEVNSLKEREAAQSRNLLIIFGILIFALLLGSTFLIFEIKSKQKVEKELYINSITDDLTKAFNRGKIIDLIENNLSEENGVILLDIDDFKVINDTYGHAFGDDVLIGVSDIIRNTIRDNDYIGRYGGEEFLIFLKDVKDDELFEIAERIRESIQSISWENDLQTTASIGVTKCFSLSFDEIFHQVDKLMYSAKAAGKNKVMKK